MKKALSFAVALGLVAGMASTAVASDILDIHGDARLRGVTFNGKDFDDATMDGVDKFDQRYRLVSNVNVNEDLMVGFRVNMVDQMFGGNQDTDTTINRLYVDRAYMKIKMLGGTYMLGRQNASWGNKFTSWGLGKDRIKAAYKNGDLTYGGYLQKDSETGDNNDTDTYAAFIIGKAGDSKWGVLGNYQVAHGAAAGTADNGMAVDVFFNTKAGAVNIMTELVFKGGDLFESSDGDAALGGFAAASTTMDALTVKGLVAFYQNNEGVTGGSRDCDNDFAPSVLIGTCQETALIDFGGTTLSGIGNADDSTFLVGVGADVKVNDKLTVGALIGYLDMSKNADEQLTEFDLTASYVLAKGVTYKASFAYGDKDATAGATDEIIVFGNNISVKW